VFREVAGCNENHIDSGPELQYLLKAVQKGMLSHPARNRPAEDYVVFAASGKLRGNGDCRANGKTFRFRYRHCNHCGAPSSLLWQLRHPPATVLVALAPAI
jgi:hypothetical protein